jgi:hypothetical protein
MRTYSKSKLLALRQCPKRLWLEIHRPELRHDSAATEARFQAGYQVGDIARELYDPAGDGVLIDVSNGDFQTAFTRTQESLLGDRPIFEAAFSAGGALALADVMLPEPVGSQTGWCMVEVKSSTSVKDYHHDDVAVQAYVARSAGVSLRSLRLAHIDSSWTYPGNNDYGGLLTEVDLTEEAFSRSDEVRTWIDQARDVDASPTEPERSTGPHCDIPYACGFYDYCSQNEPKAEHPVMWLPRFPAAKAQELRQCGVIEMRDVPVELLNATQQRVRAHTLANTVYFDREGAVAALAHHGFPACFLDFETIQFAVPIWAGTRPYQQIPFQFSLHTLDAHGQLQQQGFLDLSGADPSAAFANQLIAACGEIGPIYVYNAAFETTRIAELASRFPALRDRLLSLNERIVDLLPVARDHYYHPRQQGSWSIKKVLPAAVPELSYDKLEGVQDGGMAMEAFLEAIHPATPPERKSEIRRQLLAYCQLDTYAMVRLWQVFSGRTELEL